MNKQFKEALEGAYVGNDLGQVAGHRSPAPVQRKGFIARAFELVVESDASYFERRAAEERAMARAGTSEVTRALHQELASRYAVLAVAIREAEAQIG